MSLHALHGEQAGDRDLPAMHLDDDPVTVCGSESGDDPDAPPVEDGVVHRCQLITSELADDAGDLGGDVGAEEGALEVTVLDIRLLLDERAEGWHLASVAPGERFTKRESRPSEDRPGSRARSGQAWEP